MFNIRRPALRVHGEERMGKHADLNARCRKFGIYLRDEFDEQSSVRNAPYLDDATDTLQDFFGGCGMGRGVSLYVYSICEFSQHIWRLNMTLIEIATKKYVNVRLFGIYLRDESLVEQRAVPW
jgi:hypothetical protein